MLLKITHQTDLTYSDLISESVMELRMAPRQEEDQHRLSFNLALGPPTSASSYFDWLGNTVHAFTINTFHREIRIVATSVLETNREPPDLAAAGDTWPMRPGPANYRLYDYLQFGGPVSDSPMLRLLVEQIDPRDGMHLGELAMNMIAFMENHFEYKQGITNAASPIDDILEKRAGVCQDFTHLLIGLARAMGIPARYVSGFLHPQGDASRGHTQTHAWCELLFPSSGWIGFDAANRCVVGENFVKVAVGRNFFDVPPNKGLYRGQAQEHIDVVVKSEELPHIPPALAAERVQALNIPTYAAGPMDARRVVQQQESQQQQ